METNRNTKEYGDKNFIDVALANAVWGSWVLHIAKVGSIPSPYLGNVEEQKS